MINPQLLDYVQQQLAAGISKEEISKALVTNGWQVTDINDVFAIASSTPTTQLPIQASNLNFMQPAAVSAGTSHAGMWAIVIVLLLLVGAGGAFAAYQAGLFTTSPTAPVTNNEASTTPVLPVAGTVETASSTDQATPSATPVVATSTKAVTTPSSVKTTTQVQSEIDQYGVDLYKLKQGVTTINKTTPTKTEIVYTRTGDSIERKVTQGAGTVTLTIDLNSKENLPALIAKIETQMAIDCKIPSNKDCLDETKVLNFIKTNCVPLVNTKTNEEISACIVGAMFSLLNPA